MIDLVQRRSAAKTSDVVTITWVSFLDTVSDVIVCTIYWFTQSMATALGATGLLAFSFVSQAVLALGIGQGPRAVVASLLGVKPVLEGFNELSGG